jgi:hypothetical protein
MKGSRKQISLSRICRLLGLTRQAYYQHLQQQESTSMKESLILQEVHKIRVRHKHMGGRKLHKKLQSFLSDNHIRIGRDAFFDLLHDNGLLIRRRKRRIITTHSLHRFRKYPNKIRDIVATRPNQIWVSDITYWKIDDCYLYISLITDAYSRKIVGYHVSDNLETSGPRLALKMAIGQLATKSEPLIHHSDRGIQYCSTEYIKLLMDNNIEISMTENGDPYENALAERMNGILKEEYLCDYEVKTLQQAQLVLAFVTDLYNRERPHMSWKLKTPQEIHSLQAGKRSETHS